MNIPLDIEAAKKMGIEQWYTAKALWPIHTDRIEAIKKSVHSPFVSMCKTLPSYERQLALICYKLFVKLQNILIYSECIEKITSNGDMPIAELPDTQLYLCFATKPLVPEQIQLFFEKGMKPQEHSTLYRCKGWLKTYAHAMKHRQVNKHKAEQVVYSFYGLPQDELVEFLSRKARIKIKYPGSLCYYPKSRNSGHEESALFGELQEVLASIVEAGGYQGVLAQNLLHIPAVFEQIIRDVACFERWVYKGLARAPKKLRISISQLGTTKMRAIAAAAQRRGICVVGTSHGNNIGVDLTDAKALLDYTLVSDYLVPTAAAVKNYIAHSRETIARDIVRCRFINAQTHRFRALFTQHSQSQEQRQKNIVVEFPLITNVIPQRHLNWNFQLHQNFQIASVLKKNAIDCRIKLHPDRLLYSTGVYDALYAGCETAPFDQYIRKPYCLIFPHISTTSFALALSGDCKIIVFSTYLYALSEELKEIMREQVHVVSSFIDKNGFIQIAEKELVEALHYQGTKDRSTLCEKYLQ